MTRYLLSLCLVVLAGCAGGAYQWQHPDGLGPEVLERDRADCRVLAEREAQAAWHGVWSYGFHGGVYGGWYTDRYWYDGRRGQLGFYDPWPATLHYWDFRDRLERVCLESRGWRLEPVAPAQRP